MPPVRPLACPPTPPYPTGRSPTRCSPPGSPDPGTIGRDDGTLDVELGRPASGTGYDDLAVVGNADIAGAGNLSILLLPLHSTTGLSFDVLTYASSGGSGNGILDAPLPGAGWTVEFNATEVRVTAPWDG